ncbi:MAG: hypothetical protein ACRD1H_09130, partial [Vicinamibacterales bacterium]
MELTAVEPWRVATMTGATDAAGGLPARSELDPAYTWDLESIFARDDAWEARFAELTGRLGELETYRETISASASNLLAALRARDALLIEIERIRVYAALRASEDQTNAHYVAMADRANGLAARAKAAAAWYEPAILTLDQVTLDGYLAESDDLAVYRHYFDTLSRRRGHVRSAEVEEVLALATDTLDGFDNTWEGLTSADLTFEPFEDEDGKLVRFQQNGQYRYLASPNRRVRQAVW